MVRAHCRIRRACVSVFALAVLGLAGCALGAGGRGGVAPFTALQALEQALRGYEAGALEPLQALLAPGFSGRAQLLDAAQRSQAEQKQIRVVLSDVQTASGAEGGSPSALSARWDKRFVRAANQAAGQESGFLNLVMRRSGGAWVIESMGPDSPFAR